MTVVVLTAAGLLAPAFGSTVPDGGQQTATAAGPQAEVLRTALDDARSAEPPRHANLVVNLQAPPFLESLDSPADYAQAARRGLHVGQIVEALAQNPAPTAQRAFAKLTTSKAFLAQDERTIALIQAGASVRPAPPELIHFWDRHSLAHDVFTPTTIGALVDNGSEPALRLLERKLADPRHDDDAKLGWMRRELLRHRNDLALLQASERLVASGLPRRLRPALVDVLFDFRPGEWFKPGHGVSPPPLASASAPARLELRNLSDVVLRTVALNASQKAAVRRRTQELQALGDPPSSGPR